MYLYRSIATTRRLQEETIMNRRTANRSFRRRGLAGMLLVALAAAGTDLHASGIPVVDGAHIGINQFAWVQQYQQFVQELEQQYEQLQKQQRQIEQLYFNLSSHNLSPGYRETLERRQVNDNVDKRCRGGSNGDGLASTVVGTVKSFLSGSGSDPDSLQATVDRQRQACMLIVQTENRRYNAVVDVLEISKKRDTELENIRSEMKSVNKENIGQLQALQARMTDLNTQLANDVQSAKIMMDAYDAALKSLKDEQTRLARNAYKVKGGSLVGQAIQYGMLKTALQVARTRDR